MRRSCSKVFNKLRLKFCSDLKIRKRMKSNGC